MKQTATTTTGVSSSGTRFRTGSVRRIVGLATLGGLSFTIGMAAVSATWSAGAAAGARSTATSSMVSTVKNAKFGTILVSGNPVYTLKPSKTACGAKCLKIWPEVVLPPGVTAPVAGSGVNQAKLGTVMRSGGVLQVTYGGKPLYWFYKDTSSSTVRGNITDKWGKWYVVVTAKSAHAGSGSGSTGTTSAGSGGVSF